MTDSGTHLVRGRDRLLGHDAAGAQTDSADALRLADELGEPALREPALAFRARVLSHMGDTAEARLGMHVGRTRAPAESK